MQGVPDRILKGFVFRTILASENLDLSGCRQAVFRACKHLPCD
jgi:hypothetical protein